MTDQPNIDTKPTTMRTARRRFKRERATALPGVGFRAWAQTTYGPTACAGKLARLVGGKAKRR